MSQSVNEPQRMWGIDVIAALCVCVAFLFGMLSLPAGEADRVSSVAIGIASAVIGAGLIARINVIRVAMIGVLAVALLRELYNASVPLAGLAGWMESPADASPVRHLAEIAVRTALTLWMLWYLGKPAVRAEFARVSDKEASPAA